MAKIYVEIRAMQPIRARVRVRVRVRVRIYLQIRATQPSLHRGPCLR